MFKFVLLSVRKMNNRGLPRYLAQQNLVRHCVVSRLPAVPIPLVQAPVRMLQQPVMQAPSVIQRQVRLMRISPVPPVYQSQIMQPTFPGPRYSVQPSTIPASVTRESESQYLEYAEKFTRDYEYNQSQNLMEVDNFGTYAEYQQESTSFQQQQQDYLQLPTLHYQQPNQLNQLQQPFQQQQQYYDVQSGNQILHDPMYITMAPQAPVPAIPALPAPPAPVVSVADKTVISPPCTDHAATATATANSVNY